MGDMKGDFDALKDIKRTRAQSRVADFESKRAAIEAAITQIATEKGAQVYFSTDESGTFNIKVFGHRGPLRSRNKGSTIQFYPTKGTWQVKGRMWHGGVVAFETWVTRQLRELL